MKGVKVLQILKRYLKRFVWSIDRINGIGHLQKRKTTCIPEAKENVIISGWIVDRWSFLDIEDLCLVIDGKSYPSMFGLKRTDVSFAFENRNCVNSGFLCVIPKKDVSAGRVYTITLRIRTGELKTTSINTSISFTIDNDQFAGKNIITTEAREYSQYVSNTLSFKYISGTGIEIGALHAPMSVDKHKAQVLYVDRMPQKDLYAHYPEFRKFDIVGADIIDNGDDLATLSDNSFDFCISNHVLEHIEDPVKALLNWLRVIKPGGIVFLSVPLPDNDHDRNRQPTSIAHIIKDYDLLRTDNETFEKNRYNHFAEFVRSTTCGDTENDDFLATKIDELRTTHYSIHFHVFTEETLLQMIRFVSEMVSITVIEFVINEPEEYILIIQKNA